VIWETVHPVNTLMVMFHSLQATYIRNTLLHALRQVAPPAKIQMVPSNAVYQYPTIRDLAQFACQVTRSANASGDIDTDEAKRQRLLNLITKYTQDWPVHRPAKDAINLTDETVLLTGSTGGLGSQLLAQLVAIPSVSRIYAFNRPAQKSSRDRHVEAFVGRGNNVALLDSEKIVYVEGDAAVYGFNIQPELFAEVLACDYF
jgi:Male sterility protein